MIDIVTGMKLMTFYEDKAYMIILFTVTIIVKIFRHQKVLRQ
jgi:hypothetical protein